MKKSELATCILLNLAGACIYATAIHSFATPSRIAPGGASGIAILLNYMFGLPMGMVVFLFNVPLLVAILMQKLFPIWFVGKTLLSTLLLSLITDYLVVHLPAYQGNPLLSSIFGGALLGIGLALVHMGQSNTGGISLLGLMIQKKNPRFQVGAMVSALNICVVLLSGVVYRNLDSLLYAIVMVYISGIFMDQILENAAIKKLMIIIAESTDLVRQVILDTHIGVTILEGTGGYLGERQRVVLCVAAKKECEILQEKVKAEDEKALIIITEATRVSGKGFKHLT
ncbi:YitT family protein [Lachnospiraceae bacterium ZAX-1]